MTDAQMLARMEDLIKECLSNPDMERIREIVPLSSIVDELREENKHLQLPAEVVLMKIVEKLATVLVEYIDSHPDDYSQEDRDRAKEMRRKLADNPNPLTGSRA